MFAADAQPRVASLNLCTDSMLFELADDEQIASVTALSRDPSISYYHRRAGALPVNHGRAEDLLRIDADVVVTGDNTSPFLLGLLARLGVDVVRFHHAGDFTSYRRDLARLARLIGREARADELLAQLDEHLFDNLPAGAPRPAAVVFQPNGYVAGRRSLIDEVLALAGLGNIAGDMPGGTYVSLERLLRWQPDVLITERRYDEQPSIAEAVLAHPALRRLAQDATVRTARVTIEERLWTCAGMHTLEALDQLRAAAAHWRDRVL